MDARSNLQQMSDRLMQAAITVNNMTRHQTLSISLLQLATALLVFRLIQMLVNAIVSHDWSARWPGNVRYFNRRVT
eukprot:scaffold299733_cov44-Prasinocladus_malaysianus.AAC.1